jgi:hypothetical protein
MGMAESGGCGDFPEEPFLTQRGRQLGAQHLDGDLSVVPEVMGQIDHGHAAGTQLSLNAVAFGEGGGQPLGNAAHRAVTSITQISLCWSGAVKMN